ncbi:MAG: hypothetical protein C4530_05145 [Desulfobacteraceae bacterium]|nr:MAG: hypothetical protein C4530_05145 [Desulfobacteraceae bacterium]
MADQLHPFDLGDDRLQGRQNRIFPRDNVAAERRRINSASSIPSGVLIAVAQGVQIMPKALDN